MGVALLVLACVVGVAASAGSYALMVTALFLLGVGWNLGFVGGSALITDSVPSSDRVRVQGMGDTLIWGCGAVASIGSGWLLAHAGFAVLSIAGAAISLVPVWPLLRYLGQSHPNTPAVTRP
jgi:MFS family permease